MRPATRIGSLVAMSFGTARGFVTAWLVMTLLALSLGSSSSFVSNVGATSLSRSDCRDRTLVDYHSALERLRPPPHSPPVSHLPFLPPGLRLDRLGSLVVVGPVPIGFLLSDEVGERRQSHAGWRVRSRLTLLPSGGAPPRVVDVRRQALGPVITGANDSMNVATFRLSARPAFYRLDLVFERGHEIHRYWEYYRVLPRRIDLRLAISADSVHAGETLTWRLENFGTLPAIYGLDYQVERFDGSGWVPDPISPTGVPKIAYSMGAGEASRCQSLHLPAGMAAGRYRITKSASVETGAKGRRAAMAEFDIISS